MTLTYYQCLFPWSLCLFYLKFFKGQIYWKYGLRQLAFSINSVCIYAWVRIMIMSRKLVRNQTVRKERKHTLMYITSTKCCAGKRNPGKTLKQLKYISRTFFLSPVFIIPKVRQSSTFIINIFICAYIYIYLYISNFPCMQMQLRLRLVQIMRFHLKITKGNIILP